MDLIVIYEVLSFNNPFYSEALGLHLRKIFKCQSNEISSNVDQVEAKCMKRDLTQFSCESGAPNEKKQEEGFEWSFLLSHFVLWHFKGIFVQANNI